MGMPWCREATPAPVDWRTRPPATEGMEAGRRSPAGSVEPCSPSAGRAGTPWRATNTGTLKGMQNTDLTFTGTINAATGALTGGVMTLAGLTSRMARLSTT